MYYRDDRKGKNCQVSFYFTLKDYERLKSRAAKTDCPSLNDFMYRMIFSKPIHFIHKIPQLGEIMEEMIHMKEIWLRIESGNLDYFDRTLFHEQMEKAISIAQKTQELCYPSFITLKAQLIDSFTTSEKSNGETPS